MTERERFFELLPFYVNDTLGRGRPRLRARHAGARAVACRRSSTSTAPCSARCAARPRPRWSAWRSDVGYDHIAARAAPAGGAGCALSLAGRDRDAVAIGLAALARLVRAARARRLAARAGPGDGVGARPGFADRRERLARRGAADARHRQRRQQGPGRRPAAACHLPARGERAQPAPGAGGKRAPSSSPARRGWATTTSSPRPVRSCRPAMRC